MLDFNSLHKSVLLDELVNSIKIFENKKNIIVDATLWLWWHAEKILEKLNKEDIFIWFDADIENLKLAKKRLKNISEEKKVKTYFINSNYLNLKKELNNLGIDKITGIYYDLWLSSLHVDDSSRWFSFKENWVLDMRFDRNKWKDAKYILSNYSKEELIEIFRKYWEEPMSRKIAEKILEKRKSWFKFEYTKDLKETIEEVCKFPKSKNRIFQAIRIEVNSEIDNLKISLEDAIRLLKSTWVIFVISFHSLEDRAVKQIFKKEARDCICTDLICTCKHKKSLKLLNKKPIVPSEDEIESNPRSRSAKARLAKKLEERLDKNY